MFFQRILTRTCLKIEFKTLERGLVIFHEKTAGRDNAVTIDRRSFAINHIDIY